MTNIPIESQAKIILIWPGPVTGSEGTLSFFVESETNEGEGCTLVTSDDLEEHGLIEPFKAERLVSLLTIRSCAMPKVAFASPSQALIRHR
ncbi:hypothetical protein [Muricoccus nepalensis]|uniref:hypothetical protein n=1 Tax=Muricoccus nepalensis TaxID=1854500 RepID=UPI0013A5B252|nr:hypothetical protein [Roseomonas nepalensis]